MVTGIIGKKIGMTQLFAADGTVSPATVIKAGPCVVVQAKTRTTRRVRRRAARPRRGTARAREQADGRPLQEGERAADPRAARGAAQGRDGDAPKAGDQVLVSIFEGVQRVDVIATSRGKGFQGVVKRHHFGGGAATHGSMFHRAPGSIGASSYPSRVVKGMRAAGHMGATRVTTRNLKVVKVDAENNLLIVRGAVPGGPNGYVLVRKAIAAKPEPQPQVEKAQKKTVSKAKK